MKSEHSPQRRYPRLTFREPVSGDVTASQHVHILDLSLGGARLEHSAILRPGSGCYLRLPLKYQPVTVIGRVIWSRVVGGASGDEGGVGLLYQSGLEFGALSQGAHALLAGFLETEGTPPGDRRPPG